jgi:hypothetical protein
MKTPMKSRGVNAAMKSTSTIDSQAGKKMHRFKSGTAVSREIWKYRKT